jgi:DNA-binding response OmpR family regulator
LITPRVLTHAGITLDLERHTCSVDGQPVDLTPNEYEILATLMSHPGTALTRGQLLDQALGESVHVYERTIDVHVRNLRRKLEPDPAEPQHILTVFGVGYKFAED